MRGIDLDMTIIERLAEKILFNPNKVVLRSDEVDFTFLHIGQYSDHIALRLENVSVEKVVPVYISEDVYVLPVILGILKAGKIPLPLITSLDIKKSMERISDIDYDTIISDSDCLGFDVDNINFIKILNKESVVDELLNYEYELKCLDEAYIICTSGSTGIPKKVFLTESNIIWLLDTFYSLVDFTSECSTLFSTLYTFDVSITEIFAPIFTGGTLHCFPKKGSGMVNLRSVSKIIREKGVTHLSVTPSYAELLSETKDGIEGLKMLKFLCLAGESFSITLGRRLTSLIGNNCRIFNLYGPAETTIYATWYELTGSEDTAIPIGMPLNGASVLVLNGDKDEARQGELYIAGKGITKGYLLDNNLNNQKFSIINGVRYYATGDYVYCDDNDNLVFDCRKDEQVQVNGVRIELGEVYHIVSKILCIDACRVAFSDKRLFIFYKSKNDMKSKILESLPKYLSPLIIQVTDFLLNPNRKLDVRMMIDTFYLNKSNV